LEPQNIQRIGSEICWTINIHFRNLPNIGKPSKSSRKKYTPTYY